MADTSGDAPAALPAATEPEPAPLPTLPAEVTKEAIRQSIWRYLEDNDLCNFPRPVTHRIPNFKGADIASDKAATLEPFTKAHTVKINPDKPQEQMRFLTLEANKTLLVPTPRLRSGLFNKINPPEDCNKDILRICSTSQGVKEYSSSLSLDSEVKIDVIFTGSVAVSEKGYRIGKGEGFADLEYAMMRVMGAVDDDTLIITTVHDSQVTDIPEQLVQPHDICVDIIVTPTRIIHCPKHPKPQGVVWSMLDREKLHRIPVLKKLRYRQQQAGIDVTLRDDGMPQENGEEGGEGRGPRGPRKPRGKPRRPRGERSSGDEGSQKENAGDDNGDHPDGDKKRRKRKNSNRRRRQASEGADGEGGEEGELGEDGKPTRGPNNRRRRNRRPRVDSEGNPIESGEEGEGRPRQDSDRRRRRPRGPRTSESEGAGQEGGSPGSRPPRRNRNRNRQRSQGDSQGEEGEERRPRRNSGPRYSVPSVYVGSLPRSLRVSDFKTKVRERSVNPLRVIWHGGTGHAFLQFEENAEMEEALRSLESLEIEGKKLRVEKSSRTLWSDRRYKKKSGGEGEDEGEEGREEGREEGSGKAESGEHNMEQGREHNMERNMDAPIETSDA